VRRGSEQLARAVVAARSFPPIPDAQAQRAWTDAIRYATKAVAYYQAFLRNPGSGFVEPLTHVSVLQSITALAATNRRVTALAR
jgi:hypothetical protein